MKSNEIINEGPLDALGRAAAGIKGALTPGQTGSGAYAVKAQQQNIAAIAKRHAAYWYQKESDLAGNSVPKDQFGDYLTTWARQWYKLPTFPAFQGQYSQAAAAAYITRALRASNIAELEQQQAAPTTGNVSTVNKGNVSTNTGNVSTAGTTANAAPTTTTVATPDPTQVMFKDPEAFKAEWDKFMLSNPNFKLITDPQLLSVLKTMWKTTGGIKAESKNNKGNRI